MLTRKHVIEKKNRMSQQYIKKETYAIYKVGGQKFQDLHTFNEIMSKHNPMYTSLLI